MIAPTAIFAGAILITLRVLIFSAMAVAATASTTYAGPCSDQIDAMQARIDASSKPKPRPGRPRNRASPPA
jgi:hypothetical protein